MLEEIKERLLGNAKPKKKTYKPPVKKVKKA